MKFPLRKRAPIRTTSVLLPGSTVIRPTPRVNLPKPSPLRVSSSILAHEALSKADWIGAFDGLTSLLDLPGVQEALEQHDLATVLDILDLVEWIEFEQSLIAAATPRIRNVIAYEGQRAYDEVRSLAQFPGQAQAGTSGRGTSPPALPPTDFGDPFPRAPGPRSGFYATTRFDMTNPYAIRSAEQFAADLVREVTRSTRLAIRDAVTESFTHGFTADTLARRLRNTVGLTSRQARAVESYRERLLNGGMDEDRVDVLTRRYWRKTRNRRAETIARTEIMRASNHGRMQGWLSAADHGMLDMNASVKEWVTAPLGPSFDPSKPEVCVACGPLDGTKVMGVETEFQLPGGRKVQMPPAHPNCRCTAIIHPPEPPENWDPEYPFAEA
jgi:hypothetical protein